jgi:hypothetical protein
MTSEEALCRFVEVLKKRNISVDDPVAKTAWRWIIEDVEAGQVEVQEVPDEV